ncbi:hypothetical protein A9Z42_0015630 [Trichoderma parareesei]|uniref:Uncharacterized protein n=1 Tax=Trichoderma parareesei TaxID=858221 RepID=A0A2H2ZCN5_TRIPA|nr:hypothetical protein A9Z42_0015630 [Trichoderma parareesei]
MPEDDLTTNLAGLMTEMQEFNDPFVKPHPPQTRTVKVRKNMVLTRNEVEAILCVRKEELMKEYNNVKAKKLLDTLDEHMVAVLSPTDKATLSAWAAVENDKRIIKWMARNQEDKTEVRWEQTSELKVAVKC